MFGVKDKPRTLIGLKADDSSGDHPELARHALREFPPQKAALRFRTAARQRLVKTACGFHRAGAANPRSNGFYHAIAEAGQLRNAGVLDCIACRDGIADAGSQPRARHAGSALCALCSWRAGHSWLELSAPSGCFGALTGSPPPRSKGTFACRHVYDRFSTLPQGTIVCHTMPLAIGAHLDPQKEE